MNHRIRCILISSLFITCGLCQQSFKIPDNFVEYPQPNDSIPNSLTELNHSAFNIEVLLVNGELRAQKIDYSKVVCEDDCYCKLKIKDGTLKGINNGEWGGVLYYEPDNVDELNVRIKKGNIKYLFEMQDSLYAIEGLAHFLTSRGALFQLHRSGNVFNYSKILDFDDAPAVFLRRGSKLFIAGSGSFFILNGLRKEVVFEKLFWRELYPNSMVALDDDTFFVGIRSGFVQLNLKAKKITFYKYTGA
jgi:hypothetical protein